MQIFLCHFNILPMSLCVSLLQMKIFSPLRHGQEKQNYRKENANVVVLTIKYREFEGVIVKHIINIPHLCACQHYRIRRDSPRFMPPTSQKVFLIFSQSKSKYILFSIRVRTSNVAFTKLWCWSSQCLLVLSKLKKHFSHFPIISDLRAAAPTKSFTHENRVHRGVDPTVICESSSSTTSRKTYISIHQLHVLLLKTMKGKMNKRLPLIIKKKKNYWFPVIAITRREQVPFFLIFMVTKDNVVFSIATLTHTHIHTQSK